MRIFHSCLILDTTNDTATISTLIGGGISPPAVSTGGNGSMYFDVVSSRWMISASGLPTSQLQQPPEKTLRVSLHSLGMERLRRSHFIITDGINPARALLYFTLETSAAGVANTNVSFVLPPDMPLPHQWSGEGNSSYLGSGQLNAIGASVPGGAFCSLDLF